MCFSENLIAEDMFIDKRFQYLGYERYHKEWEDKYTEYKTRMKQLLDETDGENRNIEIEALFQKYKWVCQSFLCATLPMNF